MLHLLQLLVIPMGLGFAMKGVQGGSVLCISGWSCVTVGDHGEASSDAADAVCS